MNRILIWLFLFLSFPLCAMTTVLDRVVEKRDLEGLNRLIGLYGKEIEANAHPRYFPRYSFVDMVNAQDSNGMTVVHRILNGNMDSGTRRIVQILLENGAKIDLMDQLGYTPLHIAAKHGYEDIASKILEINPHVVDIQNKQGVTALHNASLGCHENIIRLLINHGANKDIRDRSGATPLHVAARYGKIASVNILIEAGALITRDVYGCTPLHYAAQNGRKVIVRILASHYPDSVNIPDNTGATPLHFAVKMTRYPDVKILLNAGADVLARDHEGRTPFHYVLKSRNKKMLKLFKDKVVMCINCRDNAGLTPYEFACVGVQPADCAELRTVLDDLIRAS
ncbi:MAG TPA: ankyrin repeat domain-containing protein [Candidatus Dependentiae bacterium]|nr:ankyrin repeat domain-containing protein [Candidatus Dependentiae bacterium]